jgi:hypothetical protein
MKTAKKLSSSSISSSKPSFCKNHLILFKCSQQSMKNVIKKNHKPGGDGSHMELDPSPNVECPIPDHLRSCIGNIWVSIMEYFLNVEK